MHHCAASSHGPAYRRALGVKGSLRRAAPALDTKGPAPQNPRNPLKIQKRQNFGGGGEGTPIKRSPARRINLGSIGSTQWAPEAPAAEPAPDNALHEETVKRFRHAGIGGDNTP